MPPLVSVILPVYNGERYLSEAVQSILRQSYRDLELIAVDDGSTDSSGQILAELAAQDHRIRLLCHTTNMGITASLNAACLAAGGDYIAVANQDDVCLSDRLRHQIAFLDANPTVGAVGSAAQTIDDTGRALGVRRYPTRPAEAAWLLFFFNSILHPTLTVRRAVIERAGFYPAGHEAGTEDYALCVNISLVSQICSVPQVLVRYRRHPANVTATRWSQQESEADRIVQEHVSLFLGSEISRTTAGRLRGLSTGRYTRDAPDVLELAEIIDALQARFIDRSGFRSDETAVVRRDAATRLWVLATLVSTKAPGAALALAARATRLSRLSPLLFGAKTLSVAFSQIFGALRQNLRQRVRH